MAAKKAAKRKLVLVRTYSAGVHFGTLVSRSGKEVVLADARRIWRWFGAWTLHEISVSGLDISKSKISSPVKRITLTEAIEVIDVEPKAAQILGYGTWAR